MSHKPPSDTPAQLPTVESFPLGELFTVEQLAAAFPGILSVPALRWQLRFRDTNGLGPACVRVGKKLLIHRPSYERWLSRGAGGARFADS